MAKVKMDEIVSKLDMQLQGALRDALKELGQAQISDKDLFRAFQKGVRNRCGTWEIVPNSSVDSGE